MTNGSLRPNRQRETNFVRLVVFVAVLFNYLCQFLREPLSLRCWFLKELMPHHPSVMTILINNHPMTTFIHHLIQLLMKNLPLHQCLLFVVALVASFPHDDTLATNGPITKSVYQFHRKLKLAA
jgi:hypothetical protein